jgi:hypothetical protein
MVAIPIASGGNNSNRDILAKRFRNRKKAQSNLYNIEMAWDELGEIAINLPLNQRRHKGKSADELRDPQVFDVFKISL